ncbi:hypothetical protein CMV_013010 [Castanea mollissima]|uniref:Conserved oligomeric Golgi complex subunit 3 N-terminal domain-containing protein n=1 Tax=Castanea mollissima TaxID=60419 RepID=A0A8J4REI1_9ROSI|nr:hypothetical protein CMV_013010 [Castanea mollissima]
MAAIAEVDDEFGLGPRIPSVLRFLTEHQSSAVWKGQVAMHKQMLMRYVVDSPEHKPITAMLKEVDRLHCLAAHLPLEDADTANPELPEHNGRPSTSSTPASHSHGQCAAPHQRQNQPPPPPHATPALEFPPPPHASPSPEIPPRTTPAFPDLQIPVPTARASSHPEIPSPTLCGHKAGHKAGPTQRKEPDQGDAIAYVQIASNFYSPSMSVGNENFLPLLKRLDDCILYVESNPQYAESSDLLKFRQLQSRALGMIRSHVLSVLKSASSPVKSRQQSDLVGSAKQLFLKIIKDQLGVYWEYRLKPWDMAAGALIVEEAGGTVTRMDGGKSLRWPDFCLLVADSAKKIAAAQINISTPPDRQTVTDDGHGLRI